MEKKYGESRGLDPMQLEQMRADMQQRVRTHYQSKVVAVTIPVFQAAFSGFLAGVLVAILLYALGVQAKYMLVGFVTIWVIVTGVVWFLLILNWKDLVWNVETALGVDITGDGIIGQASPQKVIKAEVTTNGGRTTSRYDIPEDTQLIRFLEAIYKGGDLSEARWTPQANGFSRSGYWKHTGTLIQSGVLRWKNDQAHAQGVELSPEGRDILEQWLDGIYEYNGVAPVSPSPDSSGRPLPHQEN